MEGVDKDVRFKIVRRKRTVKLKKVVRRVARPGKLRDDTY